MADLFDRNYVEEEEYVSRRNFLPGEIVLTDEDDEPEDIDGVPESRRSGYVKKPILPDDEDDDDDDDDEHTKLSSLVQLENKRKGRAPALDLREILEFTEAGFFEGREDDQGQDF
jgi:hypothetical protein